MAETIEIPYAGEVSYLSGKSRNPKRHYVPASFMLEIPELDPSTVRRVAGGLSRSDGRQNHILIDVIASGGRTLSPFRADLVRDFEKHARDGRSNLGQFMEKMASPSKNGFYLFEHNCPWPRDDDGRALPPDVVTVITDGRPAVEAQVRERLAGLAIHDGVVYSDRIEPVYNLVPAGGMEVIAGISHKQDLRGYAFRIDRREAARAALERATCKGGYKLSSGEFSEGYDAVEVFEGPALRFREDVHNARVAALHALSQLGNALEWMPAALIPKLHELAVARDGLATGGSDPEDISRILGEFEDAREGIGGRLVQLKHVLAIGRDMIAMSMRSERVARIDADDAEALDDVAPR